MIIDKVTLHAAYGAVMITDGHFNRPITTAVLTFDGDTKPYRVKPDGYYVLTKPVPLGSICRVDCPGYTPLEMTVEHDENGRYFALASLNHLAGNPQLTYTKKLMGTLSKAGKPLLETGFTLVLTGRIPALMLIEDAEAGAASLRLNTEEETRLIGQSFLLPQPQQGRLQIKGQEEMDIYTLVKPLSAPLKQGQQLIPSWDLGTDHKGEFVFPYKPHLLREPEAAISISYEGQSLDYTVVFPKGADGCLNIELK